MPIVKIRPEADLHYEVRGDGTPVVLVAGMGGVSSYWGPQLAPFAERHTIITFDQRGTGRSSHSEIDYTVALLADDLVQLIERIGKIPVHIVGHSTGGMIAQVLATRRPDLVASLVLYGTRGTADGFTRRAMGMRRDLLVAAGVEAYVRSTPIFLYPSWWIRDHEAELQRSAEVALRSPAPIKVMASRIEAVLNHHELERLGRIRAPTLVTCARDDFLTPLYYSRQLAELIPGSRLEVLDEGGHACSTTNPAAFNASVLEFLDSARAP